MPSIRSVLLVGLPLAASRLAQSGPETPIVQETFESRRAAPAHRHGIVELGCDAIERAVDTVREDFGFKRYLRKRQDSNATVATTVTAADVVASTDSLPQSSDAAASSQGQSLTSSVSASSPAAQDPVSTVTVVSTTLVSVPATTEQQPATSSQGQTPPTTIASGSTSFLAAEPEPSFVSSEPGSSSVAAPPSSSSPVEEPSSSAPVVIDSTTSEPASVPTSSAAPPPSSEPSSAPTSNPTSSSAVAPTTTAALPSKTTFAVINSAGSVITSFPSVTTVSDGNGQGVTLTSPTPGGVYTSSRSGGGVAIVTYTPDGGVVSEVRIVTSNLPNGSPTVITSFATVGAPATPTGGSSNSGSGSGDAPKLQSGAAVRSTWYAAELAVFVGAAVGVAAVML